MKNLLVVLLLFFAGVAESKTLPLKDTTFDSMIQSAVEKWWLDYDDWLILKAQYWQESRFDTLATSPVGAKGIAQFMPGTWSDVMRQMGRNPRAVPPTFAPTAIEAGAFYGMALRRFWKKRNIDNVKNQHDLGMASYNAGMGNIQKAWRLCGMEQTWARVSPCLVNITGRHSKETLTYVKNIHRWRAILGAL